MSFLYKIIKYRARGKVLTPIRDRYTPTSVIGLVLISLLSAISVAFLYNLPAIPDYEPALINKPVREQPRDNSHLSVEEQIREIAKVGDKGDFLISLAQCESTLNPNAVGGSADCFIGLYQWNICNGQAVTEECAYDIKCSTIATIEALDRNEQWRWPNCPK